MVLHKNPKIRAIGITFQQMVTWCLVLSKYVQTWCLFSGSSIPETIYRYVTCPLSPNPPVKHLGDNLGPGKRGMLGAKAISAAWHFGIFWTSKTCGLNLDGSTDPFSFVLCYF